MTFLSIVTEPAIIIITSIFLFFIINIMLNYTKIELNLKSVNAFLLKAVLLKSK